MPDKIDIAHEKIELKLQRLNAQTISHYELLNIQLKESTKIAKQTLAQALKTNGRVDKAEYAIIELREDTRRTFKERDEDTAAALKNVLQDLEIVRILRKRPWLTLILALGFMQIYESINISWIIRQIINFF